MRFGSHRTTKVPRLNARYWAPFHAWLRARKHRTLANWIFGTCINFPQFDSVYKVARSPLFTYGVPINMQLGFLARQLYHLQKSVSYCVF
ncbi:hypothetical protein TNCV_1875961 [Trichonephila clavipes]|nr:hypothetical protein TNCV_1875961 [Trichonephila clavipes]